MKRTAVVCRVFRNKTPLRTGCLSRKSRTVWVMSRSCNGSFVLTEMVSKAILTEPSSVPQASSRSYATHSEAQIHDGSAQSDRHKAPPLEALDQLHAFRGRVSPGLLSLSREGPEEPRSQGKELIATHQDQDKYQQELQRQYPEEARHILWPQGLFQRRQRTCSRQHQHPQAREAQRMKDPNCRRHDAEPFRFEPSAANNRDEDCPEEYSPPQVDHDRQRVQQCKHHPGPPGRLTIPSFTAAVNYLLPGARLVNERPHQTGDLLRLILREEMSRVFQNYQPGRIQPIRQALTVLDVLIVIGLSPEDEHGQRESLDLRSPDQEVPVIEGPGAPEIGSPSFHTIKRTNVFLHESVGDAVLVEDAAQQRPLEALAQVNGLDDLIPGRVLETVDLRHRPRIVRHRIQQDEALDQFRSAQGQKLGHATADIVARHGGMC